MSYTRKSNRPQIKKKVCHCKACGHIQSPDNGECEHCGFDLGLYGQIQYIDVEVDEWELHQEDRKRQEERQRREKLRQEQEEHARQEKLRQEREERARQKKRQQEQEKQRKKNEKKNTDSHNHSGRLLRTALLSVCGLLLVLALICIPTHNKCGEHLTWSFDEETGVLTIKGDGEMYNYIPAEEISLDWPEDNGKDPAPWMADYRLEILSVVIGEDVTNVGSCAFAGCANLKEVTFGDSLEAIDAYAFWQAALEDVFIPASVTQIGSGAFLENWALRNLFLYGDPELAWDAVSENEDLAIIAGDATSAQRFSQERDMIFVDLAQVREDFSLGGPASQGQQWSLSLFDRTLVISGTGPIEDFNGTWMQFDAENMEHWDDSRRLPYWSDCKRLIQGLKLEEGITAIGCSAFESCWNLTKVELCSTLESIGFQSFLSTAIIRLTVPEGVTKIDDHAFNFCEQLQVVYLPESLEVLEHGTFNMCNRLIRLTIGSNTEVRSKEGADGIFSNGHNPDGRPQNLCILGQIGSSAQEYAEEENFNFIEVGIRAGFEDKGKCGDHVTWRFVGDERTLYLEGYGKTWAYYISQEDMDWVSSMYASYQIRSGDTGWSPYRKYIEHIVVGKGITCLGPYLFGDWNYDNNMTNLKTIDLGSVQEIYAGLKQTLLEELELPASLKYVSNTVFADNDYLKTVIVSGKPTLDYAVLFNCQRLCDVWFYDEANIYDDEMGNLFDASYLWDSPVNPSPHFHVRQNSTAEEYAARHNIPYSYLD